MNKLKATKLASAIAFATAVGCGAQPVAAADLVLSDGDTITLSRTGASSVYGGAFGGGAFTANGVSVAGDSFITFCVEYTEHIALSTTYYVKVNTSAVGGGHDNDATYAGDVGGSTGLDPISNATAWLYTQFRSGTLSGYDNIGADNNSLQLAFWYLEDELGANASVLSAYGSDTVAQGWVTAVINAGWTDTGNVRVLNLYDTYDPTTGAFSGKHQDQLYLQPIPEPEIYAMLGIGLGLMGFAARRRKAAAA